MIYLLYYIVGLIICLCVLAYYDGLHPAGDWFEKCFIIVLIYPITLFVLLCCALLNYTIGLLLFYFKKLGMKKYNEQYETEN